MNHPPAVAGVRAGGEREVDHDREQHSPDRGERGHEDAPAIGDYAVCGASARAASIGVAASDTRRSEACEPPFCHPVTATYATKTA